MARLVEGKVTLVTGAASGIDRASALAFAREGAKVVVADVNAEGGEETARLIGAAGGEAVFVRADVSKAADVDALVAEAVRRFGRLDCAHNNAGIAGVRAAAADIAEKDFDSLVAVNLKGTWLSMRAELRVMLRQGSGAIVNTSAANAIAGSKGTAAYTACAAGILGITRSAALDYADAGVRINAVCPGVIRTPMIEKMIGGKPEVESAFVARVPMKRLGTPDEIAAAVVWLCSDSASFITGQSFPVDGGMVLR
jgi:NAD(P)-dependent dehydrogenase (short-subunit alcohol dehydrogenase family)